jgi:hypothetical protein
MIYEFIYAQKADFPIKLLCKVCKIPRQCYYDWLKKRDILLQKKQAEDDLKKTIIQHYKNSKCNYLSP